MATLQFCCGWECAAVAFPVNGRHWLQNGLSGTSISTATVRSGARSLRAQVTASTGYVTMGTAVYTANRHIARVYVRFASLPLASTALCWFADTDTTAPNVRFNSADSKIYAAVGTTLGASGVSVATGVWYCIDYDFNVNTAGTDACDVQVDGVACGQASGAGTSTASQVDSIGIQASTTADPFFDDFACSSTAADYPIGGGYVNHFVPTSDGTHNIAGTGDFQRGNTGTDILNATTTAFQLVDDVPLPSGTIDEADCIRGVAPANPATDYVECVFGPAPGISVPTNAPRFVEAHMARHEIATTVSNSRVALNDNGTLTDIWNTSQAGVSANYSYVRKGFATAPTGGAWTVVSGAGNFNNARMRFFSPDANPDNCLDGIMLEAEFASIVLTDTGEWAGCYPKYHDQSQINVSY